MTKKKIKKEKFDLSEHYVKVGLGLIATYKLICLLFSPIFNFIKKQFYKLLKKEIPYKKKDITPVSYYLKNWFNGILSVYIILGYFLFVFFKMLWKLIDSIFSNLNKRRKRK